MGRKIYDVPNVIQEITACFSLLASKNILVKIMDILTLQ
jgi:hypothetical protein